MKRVLGLCVLTAGCAVQPPADTREHEAYRAPGPLPPAGSLSARVGIEYLPAGGGLLVPAARSGRSGHPLLAVPRAAGSPVRVESVELPPAEPAARKPVEPRATERMLAAWNLRDEDIRHADSTLDRFTLHLVRDLVGRDRRRIEREIGSSMLASGRRATTYQGPPNSLDLDDLEDQQLLANRYGSRLLGGPVRRALLRGTFVHDLKTAFDEFKARNLPLSAAYEDRHRGWRLGRIAVRLHSLRSRNPIELTYSNGGWRIGGGQSKVRTSYTTRLTPNVEASVHAQLDYYGRDTIDLFANLRWDVSRHTTVTALAGDRLDLLTGTTFYPAVRTPLVLRAVDSSPGFFVYVEHVF